MLAGRAPFVADSTPAVLYKQAHEQPESVRTFASHLPADVDGVLATTLAKTPEHRFASAKELADALQAVAAGRHYHYVAPESPTMVAPVVGKRKQGKVAYVLAGITMLALVAVVMIVLWPKNSPPALTPTPADAVAIPTLPGETPPTQPSTVTSKPAPTVLATVEATPQATPEAIDDIPQIVVNQIINVYAGPGKNYSRAGQTTEDQRLEILARDASGGWWQACCLGGEPVWIDADLVDVQGDVVNIPTAKDIPATHTPTASPTIVPTETPTPEPYAIAVGATNLRSGPGTIYDSVGTLGANEERRIIGRNGNGAWWQLEGEGGAPAWIIANRVQTRGDVDSIPVAQSIPPTLTPTPVPVLVFRPITIADQATSSLSGGFEDWPQGRVQLGGVLFDIPSGANVVTTQAETLRGNPTEVRLELRITQPTEVYLLITGGNLYARFMNQQVGVVRLEFENGQQQTFPLIAGRNIREWKLLDNSTVATVTSGDSQEVWRRSSKHGGNGIIDMLTLHISSQNQASTLRRIVISDTSIQTAGSLDPALNLVGVTVLGSRTE